MRPTVGKFCTPEKPSALIWSRKTSMSAERVGAVDAGEHRRALDDRQHLARHLDDDRVGVAIGQQPGERASAGHAVAAGIVDDDEVDAARFLAFGREARARAAADDRLAARGHRGNFSIRAERSNRGIVTSLRAFARRGRAAPKRFDDGGGEFRVVDMAPDAKGLAVRRLPHVRSSAEKKRRVGIRVPERLTLRIERGHAELR